MALSETLRRTSFSSSTRTRAYSRSSVEEWSWISSAASSRVDSVFLKSNRVATSREAWSTAFLTSCMSTCETTSKVGMATRYLDGRTGRCPSGQREQTVNLPAQPTVVQIRPGPLYKLAGGRLFPTGSVGLAEPSKSSLTAKRSGGHFRGRQDQGSVSVAGA